MTVASESNKSPRPDKMLQEAASNVRSGLVMFTLAVKNFALYPEANPVRLQSLLAFHKWLESFLEDFENLHLDVEKDRLMLVTEIVYQDKPGEQSLVYPLFRDGIQWLEFLEHVTVEEIGDFIDLLNRFRILKEEASDDLSTALWEADFPHIKYKTADDFWESDPMADIAALKAASEESNDEAAIAYIRSGSSTVGYVLRVLAKDDKATGEGDTAGLAPGMHLHPSAKGGEDGVDAAIEALEVILSGEGSVKDGLVGGGSGSSADSEAEGNQGAALRAASEDSQTLFVEILSSLGSSENKKPQKQLSGTLSPDGALKPRSSGSQAVIDENSGDGARLAPIYSLDDDDDDDMSVADVAAKSAFKSSSYFKSEHSEYLWPLAASEEKQLRLLIETEANRNFTKDCLDILMVLVDNAQKLPETTGVLDFLADEVKYALSQGDFHYIHNFLKDFKSHAVSDPESLAEIAEEFQSKVVSPEVLEVLTQSWPDNKLTDESLNELRQFLLLLPPEAVHTLVPILTKTQDQRIETTLLEVAAVEICRINANVINLISSLKMSAILELIGIFRSAEPKLPCPTALLAGLSRNESPHVREEAARALIECNPESVKHLFHLIDDPNPAINTLVCMQLGKQRSPLVEKILFDYLNDTYYEKKNQAKEHVLNCYWAFGNCASAQSLPFLQDILLKKDWKSLLGLDGHWHRLGAAMALMLMPGEWGGGEILQTARNSRFKNIRQACQTAEEELREYRRKASEY